MIYITVELSGTELRTLPLLVLGGIIENQNSDFVTVLNLVDLWCMEVLNVKQTVF